MSSDAPPRTPIAPSLPPRVRGALGLGFAVALGSLVFSTGEDRRDLLAGVASTGSYVFLAVRGLTPLLCGAVAVAAGLSLRREARTRRIARDEDVSPLILIAGILLLLVGVGDAAALILLG